MDIAATCKLVLILNTNWWKDVGARWGSPAWRFITTEWTKAPIGAALGVIGAVLKRLLVDDDPFRTTLSARWATAVNRPGYSGFDSYLPLLAVFGGILCIAIVLKFLPVVFKAIKSWFFGIVSGLVMWWMLSFLVFFSLNSIGLSLKLQYSLYAAMLLSIVSLLLHIRALHISSRPARPLSFSLPRSVSKRAQELNVAWLDSDCPIEEWEQDVLERPALVESVATSVLISRAPVVALQGPFGDGKSSVLNLLKRTLSPHAIVVPFSTWLPGSEQTLAIDLFNDIATECRALYYIPQLRRRLLTYAKTMCGAVSYLKTLPELLPSVSQREEIEDIGKVLSLIPRRIVVLLDEMDRLQEEELQVVLKILRGVAFFPNLTYVCAFARAEVEKKLFKKQDAESSEYFEKFFPVTYAVPKTDDALLFRVLHSRLSAVFDDLKWFETNEEKKQFADGLKEFWNDVLGRLCTNLRKVTFIVNDIKVAARPIVREVYALDVVAIEALRRFFAPIYEAVWRNQSHVTESQMSWKTAALYSEEAIKRLRMNFFESLKETLAQTGQAKEAGDLLWWLFPSYAKYAGSETDWRRHWESSADLSTAEKDRRIFHPDFFPVYFRYQVPEAMFSQSELEQLVTRMNSLSSVPDCVEHFSSCFASLPKASPRRLDFLYRISLSVERFKDLSAEALGYALAQQARDYVYDIMLFMGAESGRALITLFEIAQRFSHSTKVQTVVLPAQTRLPNWV